MDFEKTIKELCLVTAPTGFEAPVVDKALELMKPFVDEVYKDKAGNAIGVKRCGKKNAKSVALVAHLDEIGLIVTGIEDGFLRFSNIGGVDPRMLPDRELTILTKKPMLGVVACLPPHVLSPSEMDKTVAMRDLRIDIGCTQEQAEKLVPIGTPVSFRKQCFPLGKDKLCGTSLDDRACFASCLRAMELLDELKMDCDVYIVGTRGEEVVTSIGAVTAAYSLKPDYVIVTDVTHAQTVDGGPVNKVCKLGEGPVIDVGPNMTRHTSQYIIKLAEDKNIPHQIGPQPGNTWTDAWPMQVIGAGVNMALISLPMRYMHTPVEEVSLDDLESLAKIMACVAARPCGEVFEC